MTVKPIPDGPRVTPFVLYRDVAAALEFLERAFGLEEHGERYIDAEGLIRHAAVKIGDSVVMLGCTGPGDRNPGELGPATQGLYVYVEDVDGHFEQARRAGARIVRELEDGYFGDRSYGAADPEGHEWYFASRVREVSSDETKAPQDAS